MVIMIPDKCGRCNKKTKDGLWVSLPPASVPKKKGKALVFAYTPMVYLCLDCINGLIKWFEQK